ncbi:uncharacterized protein LDX57_005203 [Aspergillus melleus]|uniref:uncharacterized protein n=1 Tax=Aspergillus melleus TaxID=138277 RepID=UPI001E8CCE48|nr:uncharacterized protein LDX57_005203 [Aspergillus melleus]KAH8427490.1 hypothetical protein LDX57_005203 [Aspergillus melleus]
MAAAKGMLDELHGNPQTPPSQTDTNSYLLGKIHAHNVVIACLPRDEMGPASAALVAAHMLSTFPRIKTGLVVGVGGGIPHHEGEVQDIRLGDVVISSDAKSGGVVAYDTGERKPDGTLDLVSGGERLSRPPRGLRTAVSRLEMEHFTRKSAIPGYVEEMLERYPVMRKKGFGYPDGAEDVLFDTGYDHVAGTRSCARCVDAGKKEGRIVERPLRQDRSPVVHYGMIVSGSTVVKHAPTRLMIEQEHRAICVEMEAAGIMNYFPCLVIRGISDYADSHKNDRWKAYAAATAAACAKELLEYVPVKAGITKGIQDETRPELLPRTNTEETFASTNATVVAAQEGNSNSKILSWIAELDALAQQNYLLERRKDSITMSMLQYHTFQRWVGQPRRSVDLSHAVNTRELVRVEVLWRL